MARGFKVQNLGAGGNSGTSISNAVITLDRTTFQYDGQQHSPQVMLVMLGDKQLVETQDYIVYKFSAADAGEYSVVVVGNNKYSGAAKADWKIEQAQGSISVEPGELEIIGFGATTTVKLNIIGDGKIIFSNSPYVNVSLNEENIATFSLVSTGTSDITITLQDGKNYKGAITSIHVIALEGNRILEENTWETIATIASEGKAKDIWSVGDIKKTALTGYCEALYGVQIIGFNQDNLDSTDEKYNNITYNNGSNKAGITFQFVELFPGDFKMHTYSDSDLTWENTYMRTSKMPQVLEALPDSIKKNIRTVTKKTAKNKYTSTIIDTTDTIFLLATCEIFEDSTGATGGNSEGELYQYYSEGNSTVKTRVITGASATQRLRSPSTASGYGSFCSVSKTGTKSSSNDDAQVDLSIAPAFCI